MSSFKRKSTTNPPSQELPASVRPSQAWPSILLTSTGIPSLDDILGGGLQLGTSLIVLNSDPHSAHTDLLQKYFIAQGLASQHRVHVFNQDANAFVESCVWLPGVTAASVPVSDDANDAPEAEPTRFKIAWRYEHMQNFKTTISSQDSTQEDYCRSFDLSSSIPPDTIKSFTASKSLQIEDAVLRSNQDIYDSVIERVKVIVHDCNAENASNDLVRVTRFSIPAFSGPEWGDPKPEKILRFLLRLRAILRHTTSLCVLVTVPSHLSSDSLMGRGWTEKLSWASDASITLHSSASDPTTHSMLPSHHGLVRINRLPTVHTLVPTSDRFSSLRGLSAATSSISSIGAGENNLAFKCTRKRFVIETFHLDVNGGVSERRTTPAASSVNFQERGVQQSNCQRQSDPVAEGQSSIAIESEDRMCRSEQPELKSADEHVAATRRTKGAEGIKKARKKVGFQVDRPDVLDF